MGKVIPISNSRMAVSEPKEAIHYTLQFFPDGFYFGGHPFVAYEIWEEFCVEKKKLSKVIKKYSEDNNIILTFQSVNCSELDKETKFILRDNQKIVTTYNNTYLVTKEPFAIESLEKQWWRMQIGQHENENALFMMSKTLRRMGEAKNHFVCAFQLALERDSSVNGAIDSSFDDRLAKDLDRDINSLFLDNYMDYINHPEQTTRRFSYKGIDL